jgi:hypothetical protein
MQSFNRALGVECSYCHVPERWDDATKPPFVIARNMYRMVGTLNVDHLSGLEPITCWTCHGGSNAPSRLPRDAWQRLVESWPATAGDASDNLKLTMAVYTASLGVTCTHCHVDGAWSASTRPAHAMVARMNGMFPVFPRFMPESARTQCYMCHEGRRALERLPPER